MLDTKARGRLSKIFDIPAKWFLVLGLHPNHITLVALGTGIVAGILLYFGYTISAITIFWLSGYLDAIDGSMARQSKTASMMGAMLDILCDRIVELSVIWALALTNPQSLLAVLGLVTAIFLNMTVFLTTGMLVTKKANKSFYYQPGLMERTEGFIMFTAMMAFSQWVVPIVWIFAALCLFTATQRMIEALKIMGQEEKIK